MTAEVEDGRSSGQAAAAQLVADPERGRAGAPLLTAAGLRKAGIDLSLCALYACFAYVHVEEFRRTHRPSLLLIVATELLFAVFFVFRKPADDSSSSPWDWIATVGGTGLPLLLRPTGASYEYVTAQAVQLLGALGTLLGIASLNRAIGLVPAHRETKTSGLYRFVRHPLYSAYALTNLGYLLSNRSAWNALVLVIWLAFQISRIFNEERLLSRHESYRAYCARTRWRLLPFVF